jgi:hypothetical protein
VSADAVALDKNILQIQPRPRRQLALFDELADFVRHLLSQRAGGCPRMYGGETRLSCPDPVLSPVGPGLSDALPDT